MREAKLAPSLYPITLLSNSKLINKSMTLLSLIVLITFPYLTVILLLRIFVEREGERERERERESLGPRERELTGGGVTVGEREVVLIVLTRITRLG
jgi:hypothetical protein